MICESQPGAGSEVAVPAYVVYQAEITDPERYEQYRTRVSPSILAAGGRYLVRGGDVEVLEGEAPAGRTVLLEFPTMEDALQWYRGDAYTEIRKLRVGAAKARMYLVGGVT